MCHRLSMEARRIILICLGFEGLFKAEKFGQAVPTKSLTKRYRQA